MTQNTNASQVEIVNDTGTAISVSDNGGSLTVDSTQLPAALAAGGGIKVEGVAGGVAQPISGTVDTELVTYDLDTGIGTSTNAAVGILGSSSGGAVVIPGSLANGLLVDVNRITNALPAGTNNIGDVDVLSLPKLAGANGGAIIGDVNISAALPAGANNIGDVDVLSLPSLPAGEAGIGKLVANDGVDIGDVTINNASLTVDTELTTQDYDSGAGTATTAVIGLVVPASGGAVAITGDAANGIDVDVTRLPALAAGANVIGALTANQSVNNAQIAGVATSTGNGVVGTGVQRVAIASDNTAFPVNATPPTLTKGTQDATGYSVQRLQDAGRNTTNYFMAAPIITTNAEVMMSLTGYKSGAAVAATATPAVVTSGKTYRVSRITLSYFNVAALGSARFTLRANLSGVGVIGSPLVTSWQIGISGDGASTAGHVTQTVLMFPEGLEFAAGTGIAIGMQGFGVVPTTGTVVGYGKCEVEGFEY